MRKLGIILFAFVLLTNCTGYWKVKYDGVKMDLSEVKTKNIDLVLLDHREAVIDGSRKPSFTGYMRSAVGIAYPLNTKSKNNFTDDLTSNFINSFNTINVTLTAISSNFKDSIDVLKSKLFSLNGDRKVLLIFDILHTDGYSIQFLHYKIILNIFDKEGKLLKSKTFEGDTKLGGSVLMGPGPFKKYMPKAVAKLFEDIFKDQEVLEAINVK